MSVGRVYWFTWICLVRFSVLFGILWRTLLLTVLEPHGSGGFALHVCSLWVAMSLFTVLLTVSIAHLIVPRFRPRWWLPLDGISTAVAFATLYSLWNT